MSKNTLFPNVQMQADKDLERLQCACPFLSIMALA